jgi:hypothetical protein
VRHELPEDSEPRRYAWVLESSIDDGERGVHARGRPPEAQGSALVNRARRKVGEHTTVSAPERRLSSLEPGVHNATVGAWPEALDHRYLSRLLRAK